LFILLYEVILGFVTSFGNVQKMREDRKDKIFNKFKRVIFVSSNNGVSNQDTSDDDLEILEKPPYEKKKRLSIPRLIIL